MNQLTPKIASQLGRSIFGRSLTATSPVFGSSRNNLIPPSARQSAKALPSARTVTAWTQGDGPKTRDWRSVSAISFCQRTRPCASILTTLNELALDGVHGSVHVEKT